MSSLAQQTAKITMQTAPILLFTLAACSPVATNAPALSHRNSSQITPAQGDSLEQRATNIDLIWDESKTVFRFVRRYSLEDNNGVIVPFSTKTVPAWARDKAAIDAVYGTPENRAKTILRSYKQPWTYRVRADLVGKRWDDVKEDEVVLEMVDIPSYAPYLGVMKDGIVKPKPETISPPPPRP